MELLRPGGGWRAARVDDDTAPHGGRLGHQTDHVRRLIFAGTIGLLTQRSGFSLLEWQHRRDSVRASPKRSSRRRTVRPSHRTFPHPGQSGRDPGSASVARDRATGTARGSARARRSVRAPLQRNGALTGASRVPTSSPHLQSQARVDTDPPISRSPSRRFVASYSSPRCCHRVSSQPAKRENGVSVTTSMV